MKTPASAVRFFDFHTHRRPESPQAAAIVAVDKLPPEPGCYSLMLHPWHLPAAFSGLPPEWIGAARRADVLGEIGLDRLRGPALDIQLKTLDAVLALAEELDKPVIFHCVRCRAELLDRVRPYPKLRKLLHGFAGGERALAAWIEGGFTVSLGRRALEENELRNVLGRVENWEHLGLETDDSGGDIGELYRLAEALAGPKVSELLRRNFFLFLGTD
jgi:TatD DNase family protein